MKYRISTLQRLTLWRSFGERCAYSAEPLSYRDLHIDHILPERLIELPEEMQRLIENLGLGAEFEINSYFNWLPVHGKFNRQKGQLLFDEPTARFYLSLARERYPRTVELEARYKRQMMQGKVLLPLGAAIESGVLSPTEAIQYVHGLTDDEGFQLVKEIRFTSLQVPGRITKEEAESLMHQPVEHGNPYEQGLVLGNNFGEERRVTTCLEHRVARSEGFYAFTTYAMKMESFFNETCGILNALRSARTPELSYIREPRVGVHDLALVPVSVLSRMRDDPDLKAAALEGDTIQDWVDQGRVAIKAASPFSIHLEHEMGQVLSELMRADFNADGLEDILVSSYEYAIGGSHSYGTVLKLGRLSPTGPFTLLEV